VTSINVISFSLVVFHFPWISWIASNHEMKKPTDIYRHWHVDVLTLDVYGLIFVGLIVLCVKDTVRVFKFVDANCRCLKKNCILRGSLLQSQYINMSVAIYICWFFHFVVWCDSTSYYAWKYYLSTWYLKPLGQF
jgi:hypothetical protein